MGRQGAKASTDVPAAVPAYAIETWPVDRLKPYDRNARVHGKEQIQQLRASFREFGQVWPILVRADGTIIAGHGRLEAATAEKFKQVQVIVANGWTEQQCRAFGLLDNRVPLNATWDAERLGAELADLAAAGADLEEIGFTAPELEQFGAQAGTQGLTDPDEAPAPPVTPVATRGDLWALGAHRLLCGDSTSAEDAQKVLGGVKPHLMVTDPPYGVEYDPAWRNEAYRAGPMRRTIGAKAVGKVQNDSRADWREAWALFPGAIAYVWHGGLHAGPVQQSLIAADFEVRAQIIWNKSILVISRGHYHWKHEACWYAVKRGSTASWAGDRKQSTVWDIEKPKSSDTGHGTQKPVECMKRPIENNSSPGQAVYEPFSGSGTTIIAAEMTGRVCHAIEIDPAYVDVAIKRWQDFTGQKATLEGDGRTFDEIAAERLSRAA